MIVALYSSCLSDLIWSWSSSVTKKYPTKYPTKVIKQNLKVLNNVAELHVLSDLKAEESLRWKKFCLIDKNYNQFNFKKALMSQSLLFCPKMQSLKTYWNKNTCWQ